MEKRSVTYEGLDCLANASSPYYMMYKNQSQTAIAWASQGAYAKYTVYFGVAIIFVATVKHLYYRIRDSRYGITHKSNGLTSTVDVLLSYCRFVGYKQVPSNIQYFTSLPNSIGSSLFMFLSSMYLLCYCLVPHFWYRGCSGFGSPPLAVRAGLMATALTPFIYVLAGKSNAITLLTGISYEKLNVHHQYVGVAAFVLSLIHIIPFLNQDLREGGASRLLTNFQTSFAYYSGIPPTIFLGFLCILSKSWFRKHIYEIFLHSHWVFGIAYFATLIWHIDKSLGADNYMWGALAFWASQILYRILVKTAFKPTSMFLRSREATLHKLGTNVYQVTVANVKGYNWGPGQHFFLRFVGARILDNHPFSIASVNREGEANEMKFIIVPQKGLTRKHYLELDQHISCKKKVFIDGPYGGTFREPTAFDRVVLISSGSGVTATLPFLTYLARNISQLRSQGKPIITKGISFIWVVRQSESINWIRDELMECQKLAGDYIQIHIYVTDSELVDQKIELDSIEKKNSTVIENTVGNSESDSLVCSFPKEFTIDYKKPSISRIVSNLKLSRRNIIVSSGSASMKKEISSATSKLQSLIFNNDIHNSHVEEIYLHTESFGW
ncbi:Ferric/cupric reductase transmembrane component 7 [Spathaspora sp. JA1]|nr:Ferric/cupric reductase transmembrane component 7 [Spathaspora sp. JA1]